ncbi:MAG: glycosyltransferase [archaeon]|nr:glycosyltransferase [archaeon]
MNILIIKTGALGDVLRTTFIAQALKDKYRNSNPKIFWLTSKQAMSFFVNNPYVDRVIPENETTLSLLKSKSFDLVINLEESVELCKLASSIPSKEIIGFYFSEDKIVPSPAAREWFDMSILGKKPQNDILKKKNKKTHRQKLAEMINVNYKKYEPFLRLTQEQRKIASDFLRRYNLSRKDLVIGINTGAADTWPKALSVEKTARLIDLLYKKYNAKILLFGGPNEIERNNEVLKLTKSPVINTGCGNDLLEFPALTSVCNLFITTDSLGVHVALALKRKTICLIGPTSPSEIDMYNIGEKVVANSKCVCCYKKDCKSMEKIEINKIIQNVDKLLRQKVTFLITAFKEPRIGDAIESALNQKTFHEYEIIVSAPDKETQDIILSYNKKDKRVKLYKDPGKGKSFALNMLFKELDSDILILTDGDVFVNDAAVENIVNTFLDPEIGCVTGRPVPLEEKNTMFGYWANFLFESAHRLRRDSFKKGNFLECSGYLFAFRKKFVDEIPLDVAEDTVIPYYFWEKGYRIGYAPEAEVFVKNVDNWGEWLEQKTRTSKAHETLHKYVDVKTTPRVKSFKTEIKGITWLFTYPRNPKQFFWSLTLGFSRFYMWGKVFFDTKFQQRHYQDAWKRIESTKSKNP